MNQLLVNDEAECGLNPNSEDLGKYQIRFHFNTHPSLFFKDIDAEEDDG